MKNRMSIRKVIGKISTFLRSLKSKNTGSQRRRDRRNPDKYPNSTKVGAGSTNLNVRRNFIVSNSTKKRKNAEKRLKQEKEQ